MCKKLRKLHNKCKINVHDSLTSRYKINPKRVDIPLKPINKKSWKLKIYFQTRFVVTWINSLNFLMKTLLRMKAIFALFALMRHQWSSRCCHVRTIVWLHHLDSNEIHIEKARRELNKNVACYFERILEAASYKAAVIQLLASHLTKHPNKTKKACWTLLWKKGRIQRRRPPISSYILIS